jgi:hypothetical protein
LITHSLADVSFRTNHTPPFTSQKEKPHHNAGEAHQIKNFLDLVQCQACIGK